jgi:hypothetical protein
MRYLALFRLGPPTPQATTLCSTRLRPMIQKSSTKDRLPWHHRIPSPFIDNRTAIEYDLPIYNGTIRAMDLRKIEPDADDFGLMTYHPAFMNTASCRSDITFIDGERAFCATAVTPSRCWRYRLRRRGVWCWPHRTIRCRTGLGQVRICASVAARAFKNASHSLRELDATTLTYGFFHSVRLLNSSTISSNLWNRRS